MSLWDKVVSISNRAMNTKAQQILDEVYERGYHYYPDSVHVVPSFHIMSKKGHGEVMQRFETGGKLVTSVIIGSELREAYWAVYGNVGGSRGGRIYPNGPALVFPGQGSYRGGGHGKGGKYVMPSVRAYRGHNFLRDVARRHGG